MNQVGTMDRAVVPSSTRDGVGTNPGGPCPGERPTRMARRRVHGDWVVTVKLMGGLGNQLFQYALGRTLSLRLGAPLKLDISDYNLQNQRRYALGKFNIVEDFVGHTELAAMRWWTRPTLRIIKAGLRRVVPGACLHYVKERSAVAFDPDVLNVRGRIYLDGYWQNEKYFMTIAPLLRQEVTLKKPADRQNQEMAARIQSSNAVALHVRRGDYVSSAHTNSIHGTCSLEYYRSAVDRICSQVNSPHFFIFSDDPAWTQANLRVPGQSTYVVHNLAARDEEDLRLMAGCQHFIIANSSFSWWGAWLAPNPEKIVIAPQKWFAKLVAPDLIPSSWINL